MTWPPRLAYVPASYAGIVGPTPASPTPTPAPAVSDPHGVSRTVQPDLIAHIAPLHDPSWWLAHAPLVGPIVTLVGSVLALVGVPLLIRASAAGQRADVRAAFRRQQREFAAAEKRERKWHQRERMSIALSETISSAFGMILDAVTLNNFRKDIAADLSESNADEADRLAQTSRPRARARGCTRCGWWA
jgi:hypothetical protein